MSKNKHLTFDERCQIEHSLNDRDSFKAIGRLIGKDCTTISKEIKGHIIFKKEGAPHRPFNDCTHRTHCSHYGDICPECSKNTRNKCGMCGICTSSCPDYAKEECLFLSKPPYVCNGCVKRHHCTLEKRLYVASLAQKEYAAVCSESRSGFNLTENELKQLDSIVSPLLKNGQSIHHIIVNNQDQISCCDKTLYLYADNGLLSARNIDMPRKVRFRPRKAKSVPLKVDKTCRIHRTFQDFLKFREDHPDLPVVQLDSVEGIKGGAVLLTVHFIKQKFQLAFFREANDSKSVTAIFNCLYDKLGASLYCKLFPILLADNGSEFSDPAALEFDRNGERRSFVFYCDPSSPGEKGSCEVNHEFIRRIIPKGKDIGRYTPAQIRLMMNHINSYSRPELENKAPYELMAFYYGQKVPELLGFSPVAANEIILKPQLFSVYSEIR